MEITKTLEDNTLNVALEGRLDTTTAPELEGVLNESLADENITDLIFDFSKLEYISSAGLRVLLATQKIMNGRHEMKIRNVNEVIKEVFDVTGFCDILTIE